MGPAARMQERGKCSGERPASCPHSPAVSQQVGAQSPEGWALVTQEVGGARAWSLWTRESLLMPGVQGSHCSPFSKAPIFLTAPS